jgi:branched-chain amino acid transport system substrate-binding protein
MIRTLILTLGCIVLATAADEILIGQPCALEGPAKGLGQRMNLGLRAAISEVNAAGGVHGRMLKLVAVNDGYDPDTCVDATVKLIEEDKVFCLAGLVGTPTSTVALPIAIESGVPVVGMFTGAMGLRQPLNPLVFHIRSSYDDETELLVEHLTADLGVKRIAVFHQNDSFGKAGLSGTEKALAKRGMKLASTGTYERNTVAVRSGLAAVQAGNPDAVVMIGPYKPVAAFVREARAGGLQCPLAAISFVGTESIIAELADEANGLVISQVVPSPSDPDLALAKAYRSALVAEQADATPSYVSYEGYIGGRVLIAGLQQAGQELTRAALVTGLESLSAADLGGLTIHYAADHHIAMKQLWLTRVQAGEAKTVEKLQK